jgi:DnaJ-class molecular chaperone
MSELDSSEISVDRFVRRRYLCERCGGTGEQPDGCWNGTSYNAKAGQCDHCHGSGQLGVVPKPMTSAE